MYLGLRVMKTLVTWLPRPVALALASWIGRSAFLIARRERNKTLEHLRLAYGHEKSEKEIKDLGKAVFEHFAYAAVDAMRFSGSAAQGLKGLIDAGNGPQIIKQVLSKGRGGIILTAHFGNWELMGTFVRLLGFPATVVGRRLYYDKFDEFIIRLRTDSLLRTIYQDASPREFLKVLQANELLGILADQDIDRLEGIFVPFFGRPAYTLTSPVKMALAMGAPLIPTFLVRQGDRYRFLVEDPIEVEMHGSREDTLREYTQRWSRIIEDKIRQYPEQWVWMHRRWKTKPPAGSFQESVPVGESRS